MNENNIIEHIKENIDGVEAVSASRESGAPEVAWGDTFFIYDPDHRLIGAQRFPFATIVTKDYDGFDHASNLNRPGVFRVNVGVSSGTFDAMFGTARAPGAGYDFAALDTLLPHPVYAPQHWVSILNPSLDTFMNVVRPLLVEAYEMASARYRRRFA